MFKIIMEKQTQKDSLRGRAAMTIISISSLTSLCIPATTGTFVDGHVLYVSGQ